MNPYEENRILITGHYDPSFEQIFDSYWNEKVNGVIIEDEELTEEETEIHEFIDKIFELIERKRLENFKQKFNCKDFCES